MNSLADKEGQETSQRGVLLRGGNLVVKLLEGEGTQGFVKRLRPAFAKVHYARPAATRSESREVYLVGLGRRTSPELQVRGLSPLLLLYT